MRIFIVYRQEPGIDISHWPLVTPVNDVKTAMVKAKEAAGNKNDPNDPTEPKRVSARGGRLYACWHYAG